MTKVLLSQFAKWPALGKVKTRLAKTVGEAKALDIHVELTDVVMANLQTFHRADQALWFDHLPETKDARNEFGVDLLKRCQTLGIPVFQQVGGDLGERMFNALSQGLQTHEKVIIVGSDCPTVDAAYLAQAVRVLDDADVVLGPSDDGGYVLIGARRIEPSVLATTAWGQGEVLATTQRQAMAAGFSVTLLDETWDVDEWPDYQRWKSMSPG